MKRYPIIAGILSLIVPGLGQIYGGESKKGAAVMAAAIVTACVFVSLGVWPFVVSTFFLGIGYGWISYRTGSIRWNAISHSIGGILDMGGAIAPSILALLIR